MTERAHTIVIGSGIGGLAAAALLQHRRRDERVLVLEAHTRSGGCASAYDRYLSVPGFAEKQRFRLDVGATTLSGLGGDRPVERLLRELGATLDAVRMDPGITITLRDGTIVQRYARADQWYAESGRVFGEKTIGFWKEIDAIAARAWQVSSRYPRFPFTSFSDLLSSARRFRPADLLLLKLARTPLLSILRNYRLAEDMRFRDFVDQLLMISVQCTCDEASTLVAALGLEYPSHTYYVNGGLYRLAETLEASIVRNRGDVRFKALITRIDFDASAKRFTLTDAKGHLYECSRLVSNATIWDSLQLLGAVPDELMRSIESSARKPAGERWGALMLSGIVSDTFDDGGSLYHQFHTSEGSLFLSISHRADTMRAPKGWRTISVSSHEANAERWLAQDKETYEREQAAILARFDALLSSRLPGYAASEKLLLELGTPRTFSFYTHRRNGWVGGIAHSVKNWMPRWQANVTTLKEFYLVGDTVFPGQGTPAVVQSAINLCDRIARS